MMIILQLVAMAAGGVLFGGAAIFAGSAEWFVVLLTVAGAFAGWVLAWISLAMGWIR